jgi:hypothetical protein
MKRAYFLASVLSAFVLITMADTALAQNQKSSESSERKTAVQKWK